MRAIVYAAALAAGLAVGWVLAWWQDVRRGQGDG
jgi:hypothetical protein